eukprot:389988_1
MSSDVVEQYISEYGYKPETLQKLMNYVKEKGISMKYSQVKKAFESMKKEIRSTPNRDTIKSETTNLDVNSSKIDIDLMPTPEAEQQKNRKQDNTNENNNETEHKIWTFDITKATEAINIFEKLNKKTKITTEILPNILEWANNNENKYGITLSELKQAYSQKKAFEAMDLPSNKKKKKRKKNKKDVKKDDDNKQELEIETQKVIELKSIINYCTNDLLKEILEIYYKQWKHEPENAKQLLNFIDEQKLVEKNNKYKDISFEMLSKYFEEYEIYKKDIDIKNMKIKGNKNKKLLSDFNCRDLLNKYIEKHGEPKDSSMFWRYVLDIGFDIEFKQLDEEYNKVKGVKKGKKKKVKITRTSKKK